MNTILIMALFFCALTFHAKLVSVKPGVYRWVDHPVKISDDRESREILEGTSPHFEYLEIHATTQYPGAKPSTEHANEDIEECIIVKEGAMEATIEGRSQTLGAGSVILLMPQQMHSLKNIGKTNLTYYVMRYRSRKKMDLERGKTSGGSLMLSADSLTFKPSDNGGGWAYFDRPTSMCERFEMHVTQLNKKGASHKPHSHIETEIILVISGKTEMTIDGKEYKAGAGDFYFINSQLIHGVSNATDEPCKYFAFKWN
jgi:quercetin dioxygenase-like cupin family protein